MLVMVWLLPVPGGPCSTKLTPAKAACTASCWLESASRTWKESSGRSLTSYSCGLGMPEGSGGSAAGSPARARMTGCVDRDGSPWSRSEYISNLEKWNKAR